MARAGPFNATDAAETPFQATVNIADLDIAASGFVDPASGLAGRIQFAGSMTSDGQRLGSKGKVNATGVRLVAAGTPARVPIEFEYESEFSRKTRTGVIKQGDVHIGTAVARLVGDYNASGESTALRMKLTGKQMPASELEATLPALGIALPSGASLKQGTLDMNLVISGPIDRLVIAGPIGLANVTLVGFDLAGKLSALPSLGGLPTGGNTLIQTLAANVARGAGRHSGERSERRRALDWHPDRRRDDRAPRRPEFQDDGELDSFPRPGNDRESDVQAGRQPRGFRPGPQSRIGEKGGDGTRRILLPSRTVREGLGIEFRFHDAA